MVISTMVLNWLLELHLNNDFKLVAGVASIYAIFHIVEVSSADCSKLLGYHGEIMSHVEGL